MSLSRAEIDAELKRRGVPIPQEQGASPLSRAQIDEELKRRGVRIPEDQPQQFSENPFISGARGFNTKFDRVFHGILQPLLESGKLGQRLSGASKEVARNREAALQRSEQANPFATTLGSGIGDVALNVPALMAGGGAASVLPKILRPIVGGALGGGALGAAEYTDDDRLANALAGAGKGAAYGAGGQLLGGAAKLGKTLKGAYPAEKLAERIAVTDKNAMRDIFSKRYSKLFEDAAKNGVDTVSTPKINAQRIFKHTTKDESAALKQFLKSPTLKNAHEADKDLGKVIRRLSKINDAAGLTTPKLKALESAKRAQSGIQKSVNKSLTKGAGPELANEYSAIKKAYMEDYLPYKNPLIKKYLNNKLTAPDLINKLGGQGEFRAQLAHKYPEVKVRQIPPAIATLATKGGSNYGTMKLIDLLGGYL